MTPTQKLSPAQELAPEIAAVIAAAVHLTLGAAARVASVSLQPDSVSLESAPLIWSLEGRRQIYTSHRVR